LRLGVRRKPCITRRLRCHLLSAYPGDACRQRPLATVAWVVKRMRKCQS
jgi:hypothetical protein